MDWKLLDKVISLIFFIFLLIFPSCTLSSENLPAIKTRPGEIVENHDHYGTFFTYVPEEVENPRLLALIHGTPLEGVDPEPYARYYASNWTDFADREGIVLIAPVFNQADFSSRYGDRARGGYRGLFGREIGADAWLIRLVEAHQAVLGGEGAKFFLYGHSAGGQFAARFLVTHPELVEQAVISSAATYPQPMDDVSWPFGMGEFEADLVWDDGTITHEQILLDVETWLSATQVPLTVIVGLNDTTDIRPDLIPGQQGTDRITIG